MNQKGWTLTEILITIFAVYILIAFIGSCAYIIKGCSDVAGEIQKKSVIERIWEGDWK